MPLQEFVVSTGIIIPATSDVKSGVQTEFKAALGTDLLLDDASPQGRLIDNETAARMGVLQVCADVANQINPNTSTGTFLASLCALHGVKQVAAAHALVPNTVMTGKFGTIIPVGSRVSDSAGNKFVTTTPLVIGQDGTVTTTVKAVSAGEIVVEAGGLNTIIDGQIGWASVSNSTSNAGFVGANQQTDSELRAARNDMLSVLGKATPAAVAANVLALDGVNAVALRENPSPSQQVIDGVVLPGHSTWVCVDGGAPGEVATALLRSKQQGSPWTTGTGNGTPVSVSVLEPYSGQLYDVSFVTPTYVPCSVRVTLAQGMSSSTLSTAVPDAILAYAAGQVDGLTMLAHGTDVSPFEIAAAISSEIPGVFVSKVEVSYGTPLSWTTNSLPIALWEKATFSSGNISVLVTT